MPWSWVWLSVSALTMFPPQVGLPRTGQRVSLFGTGPPVVFSSGLFGMMPRRIYTRLFDAMVKNVTLVVLNDASPVTADTVEDVADALRVDQVGFFSHSSIDLSILESERVRCAVLCDPVAVPRVELGGLAPAFAFKAPRVQQPVPVLVIRAAKAYDEADVPIPDYLAPEFPDGASVQTTYPDVGHADLLDDPWADIGARALPWMRGVVAAPTTFDRWTYRPGAENEARASYRLRVADMAAKHLLRGTGCRTLPASDDEDAADS